MKVLQINSVCGIGSTGRIALDIHRMLLELGHESYIAYGRDAAVGCDAAIKIGSTLDTYMHVALTRIFDKHGFGSRKATYQFIEQVKQLDPDIIHLHNIHGYYINIEILFEYLQLAGKPVVWTLHDCWSFTGHCAYFDYANCDKWKTGCSRCPETASYPASLGLDGSIGNYEKKRKLFTQIDNLTIVTPSHWLAGLVKQSYLSKYPVQVIQNGIDLDVFKPTQTTFREVYNLEEKFIILGVASVWDRRKGLEYFIELSKMITEEEVIVLVGVSEEQRKGLPGNIIGITRTNNIQELLQVYTAANVFVNLTLEDNFPTTNLEALACSTPVITFNTGGSVESIDERSGFIVEKKDMVSVRSKINEVKENKIVPADCVNRSKLFDKNIKFAEYIGCYEKQLAAIKERV